MFERVFLAVILGVAAALLGAFSLLERLPAPAPRSRQMRQRPRPGHNRLAIGRRSSRLTDAANTRRACL